MYSEGAINSMVALWTSGRLCGSPYDRVTGLYMNSSGTKHQGNTFKKLFYSKKVQNILQTYIFAICAQLWKDITGNILEDFPLDWRSYIMFLDQIICK